MLNMTLLKNVLIIAMASSIISTALTQQLKESLKCKEKGKLPIKCFLISMIIGTMFSLTFSDINIKYALWVGLISFIGADAIYKTFEDKIFKSFSSIENAIYIERKDKKNV